MKIRKARIEDLGAVHRMIQQLAAHQNAASEMVLSLEQFKQDFRTQSPAFELLVAEENQALKGFALYFFTYSTWKGKCLYLEDLYVDEMARRQKVGKQLMQALVKEAQNAQAQRMAWQVLDENTGAIAFYEQFPAHLSKKWINVKIESNNLENLYQK